MRNLRTPNEPIRHLPIRAFMRRSMNGRYGAEVPGPLLFAAVLFTLSAVLLF